MTIGETMDWVEIPSNKRYTKQSRERLNPDKRGVLCNTTIHSDGNISGRQVN
jgi:hypothetical protein